jgi:hypothetical protein
VHVLDRSTIDDLRDDLGTLLSSDPTREQRHEMRDLYFDGLGPGESTQRFWDELSKAIRDHDAALKTLSRVRVIEENA